MNEHGHGHDHESDHHLLLVSRNSSPLNYFGVHDHHAYVVIILNDTYSLQYLARNVSVNTNMKRVLYFAVQKKMSLSLIVHIFKHGQLLSCPDLQQCFYLYDDDVRVHVHGHDL